MVEVEVENNKIYVVTGPARIIVKEGEIQAQATSWKPRSTLVIPSSKSIPIYSTDGAKLEVVVGEGGSIELCEDRNPVRIWVERLEDILKSASREGGSIIVVFLGGVESGKTTATVMMANLALKLGFKKIAVIDGDVGQADVGPPTFISMGWVEKPILNLREVEASTMFFVGDTTPYTYVDKIVLGTKKLASIAEEEGAEVVVIDTDGWFKGLKAYNAKIELLKTITPEAIFIIGDDDDALKFYEIISNLNFKAELLPPPKNKRVRSKEDRRSLRNQAYTRVFRNAENRTLKLGGLHFTNFPIGGRRLSLGEVETLTGELGLKVIYGEVWTDTMLLVLEKQPPPHTSREVVGKLRSLYGNLDYIVVWKGWEEGLIASVLDGRLQDVAPAIIREINYLEDQVRIYTPWRGEVKGLTLGRVRLQILENGIVKEVGKV